MFYYLYLQYENVGRQIYHHMLPPFRFGRLMIPSSRTSSLILVRKNVRIRFLQEIYIDKALRDVRRDLYTENLNYTMKMDILEYL